MFLGLPDPHPDPLVRGTDPKIRVHTKMSRIPNTGQQRELYQKFLFISLCGEEGRGLVTYDCRSEMADMHLLGNVGGGEVNHDPFPGTHVRRTHSLHNTWRVFSNSSKKKGKNRASFTRYAQQFFKNSEYKKNSVAGRNYFFQLRLRPQFRLNFIRYLDNCLV
jgi:hypothetical protein